MLYVILNEKGQYMNESRHGDVSWVSGGSAWATSSYAEAQDVAGQLAKPGASTEVVNVEILN
jgi:hypothetical protein